MNLPPRLLSSAAALVLSALSVLPVSALSAADDRPAPATVGAATAPAVPAANLADLAAVSTKLNAITSLKADFTQVDAQGTAHGRFYLARPGGLRFEYNPPRKLLVVANDRIVVVEDRASAPYRVGVDQTPLRLLLKPHVNLSRDANIVDVHRDGGMLYVTAAQTKGYGQGEVTFVFAEPSLQLERWVATNPMGVQTMVTLSNLQHDAALDPSLFKLPELPPPSGIGPVR